MRAIVPCLLALLLTACVADPPSASPTPAAPPDPAAPTFPPAPPGGPAHELTLPASYASSYEVFGRLELVDDHLAQRSELVYALVEGSPRHVTVTLGQSYLVEAACVNRLGQGAWASITDVQGTAATVALVGGTLLADLREEGTVTVTIAGEVPGLQCTIGGEDVTTVPFEHQVVLRVQRVTGFTISHWSQQLTGCEDDLVLPSDAPWSPPTARPLDALGNPFDALNAPSPLSLTVASEGVLTLAKGGQLSAAPGTVSVRANTDLPVRGLRSFEVVGPETLTSLQAALYLSRTAAKGDVVTPIDESSSYPIFFPGKRNTVEVQVGQAETTRGKLCANVPGAWFAATSSTPEQCVASVGSASVATLIAPGECRLEVTIPGTSQRWATRFTTTW